MGEHDHQYAEQAIDEFGRWIQNADVKAGVLAAVVGSVVAGLGARVGAIGQAWHASGQEAGALVELVRWLLVPTLAAIVAAVVELGRSQTPRLHPSGPTHMSVPWAAGADVDDLARSPYQGSSTMWAHAQLLARIAHLKYVHVRRTAWLVMVAVLLLVAWLVTVEFAVAFHDIAVVQQDRVGPG